MSPRCTVSANAAETGAFFGEGAELGEAVRIDGDLAVGMLRARTEKVEVGHVRESTDARVASVARVGLGGAASAVVEIVLGVSSGDAPAPQPFTRSGHLYAVSYAAPLPRPESARGRTLTLHHLGATAERLLEFPTETDASAEYDVIAAPVVARVAGGDAALDSPEARAGALVAWDESVGTPPRGVIEVAALSTDLREVHAVRTVHVAPPPHGTFEDLGTQAAPRPGDAGDPRLSLREPKAGGRPGFWLTWVTRRLEHPESALPLPAGEIETTSEESTNAWVEAIELDEVGKTVGLATRLTPVSGHVGSYSVSAHDGVLDVLAEDDGAAAPGGRGGGNLLRVVWRGEGSPESSLLVRGGVEEETPPSVVGSRSGDDPGWLTFLDVKGETELLPLARLDARPAPKPVAPSLEPLLSGARLLVRDDARLLLATADRGRWNLRWATCTR